MIAIEFARCIGKFKITSCECQVLRKGVCTTAALHTYIYISVDKCTNPAEADHFEAMYRGLVLCAAEAIDSPADRVVLVGRQTVEVDAHGQVSGFAACLGAVRHSLVSKMMCSHWDRLWRAGSVSAPLSRDTVHITDVASFLMRFARRGSGILHFNQCGARGGVCND